MADILLLRVKETMIEQELAIAKKNNASADVTNNKFILQIKKVLCNSYPSNIEKLISPGSEGFGGASDTKSIKYKLRMYDRLQRDLPETSDFLDFLDGYKNRLIGVENIPKLDLAASDKNIKVMERLYIIYMLLIDGPGSLEGFVDHLSIILAFEARLLRCLNGLQANVLSIFCEIKRAVYALAEFSEFLKSSRFIGNEPLDDKWSNILKLMKPSYSTRDIKKYIKNVVNTEKRYDAVFADFTNVSIENLKIRAIYQLMLDELLEMNNMKIREVLLLIGRIQMLNRLNVMIFGNCRSEATTFLQMDEFLNATYDSDTKCFYVLFKDTKTGFPTFVPFPQVIYFIQLLVRSIFVYCNADLNTKYVFIPYGSYRGKRGLWPLNGSKMWGAIKQWLPSFCDEDDDKELLNSITKIKKLHELRSLAYSQCSTISQELVGISNHSMRTARKYYSNTSGRNLAAKEEEYKNNFRVVLKQANRDVSAFGVEQINFLDASDKLKMMEENNIKLGGNASTILCDTDHVVDAYNNYVSSSGDEESAEENYYDNADSDLEIIQPTIARKRKYFRQRGTTICPDKTQSVFHRITCTQSDEEDSIQKIRRKGKKRNDEVLPPKVIESSDEDGATISVLDHVKRKRVLSMSEEEY